MAHNRDRDWSDTTTSQATLKIASNLPEARKNKEIFCSWAHDFFKILEMFKCQCIKKTYSLNLDSYGST